MLIAWQKCTLTNDNDEDNDSYHPQNDHHLEENKTKGWQSV